MGNIRNLKNFDRVLVVEGYSDLLFFAECLERVGKHEVTFIQEFNGKEDLIAKLETFITPQLLAEKAAIGIITDANGDAAATFQSIQTALTRVTNQTVPSPGVWTAGQPRIGVFVPPDNANDGEIETLVWSAWRGANGNSASVKCIETFISCMQESGSTPQSPDKGRISALLAVRNDDDPRLGPGARARVFDLNCPEFSALRDFLSQL